MTRIQKLRILRKSLAAVLICIVGLLAACGEQTVEITETTNELGYRQITQSEAMEIMENRDDYILLDVRTEEEFNEVHIPGAICIPYEDIGTDEIPQLPDKDQIILVYCRSGRRSKIASENLAAQGYTNVLEFGGIIDWLGDKVYPLQVSN
ncbi:MAG: rhodanese-like domain-containing protein [Saccharofermentans sp.]|nr:rhodanese-like domain-containing protein [Saccharofermentans sp.]